VLRESKKSQNAQSCEERTSSSEVLGAAGVWVCVELQQQHESAGVEEGAVEVGAQHEPPCRPKML